MTYIRMQALLSASFRQLLYGSCVLQCIDVLWKLDPEWKVKMACCARISNPRALKGGR